MPDSHSLIDALLDDTPGPVTAAVRESRRTNQSRRVAASVIAVVLLTGFLACVWLGGHRTTPSETRIAAAEAPGFRTFFTSGTSFSLRQVSTGEAARPVALFSNHDVQPAFREIDDQSLFELLHPYAPVIVYLGHGEQPTLLFLDHRP